MLDGAAPTLLAVGAEVPVENSVPHPARPPAASTSPRCWPNSTHRQIVSVFLEGGLDARRDRSCAPGLVDRVVAYLAPAFLGSGKPALGDAGVDTIGGIHRWEFEDVVPIGPDLRITARPAPPKEN